MDRSQSAQRVLAWLVLVGAALQFFLAGLGVFRAKPHGTDKLFESSAFDLHRVVGDAIILLAFALLVVAIVNREQIRLAVILFVLMLVQYGLAHAGDGAAALAALHPLNGLAVLAFAHLLTRGPRPSRPHGEAAPESEPPPEATAPAV